MVSKVSALREILVESLNLEEFRTLCYDLSIDYDELPGESKTAKCRELIAYLQRRDQLDTLIAHLETSRTDLQEELAAIKSLPVSARTLLVACAAIVVVAIATYLAFGARPNTPAVPTVTTSPSPTATPTSTPTPIPPFITDYVYEIDDPWGPALVELEVEPGILPSETITGFLRLSRLALGTFENDDAPMYDVTFRIKNTSEQPMTLDLDARFFSAEDEQGRSADLVAFCCDAHGVLLTSGQEREVRLVFKLRPEWVGKGGSSVAFIRVRGFLPVTRASWEIPLPVTAD